MIKKMIFLTACSVITFNLALSSEIRSDFTQSDSDLLSKHTAIESGKRLRPYEKKYSDDELIILSKRTKPMPNIFSSFPLSEFYMICCPAENAQPFAQKLIEKGVNTNNLTVKKAAKHYERFIKYKLITNNKNPKDYANQINSILLTFNDMYEGIVAPFIRTAALDHQKVCNDLKGIKKARVKRPQLRKYRLNSN